LKHKANKAIKSDTLTAVIIFAKEKAAKTKPTYTSVIVALTASKAMEQYVYPK